MNLVQQRRAKHFGTMTVCPHVLLQARTLAGAAGYAAGIWTYPKKSLVFASRFLRNDIPGFGTKAVLWIELFVQTVG
jgi:hypothetical protein